MTEPRPAWDDEELKALGRVVHAFRSYAAEGLLEVARWRRQHALLSERHRKALAHVPSKCDTAEGLLEADQKFLDEMLEVVEKTMGDHTLGMAARAGDVYTDPRARPSPSDAEKVRYVLKNIMRDWSKEGLAERQATYGTILAELENRYRDKNATAPPRVLVPGCGLGRLVAEIAAAGFDAEGNEFSYFMLLPSSLLLNHSAGPDTFVVHPWTLATCNQVSDDDQLRAVEFPDVDAGTLLTRSTGSMSMAAGDFVEVYARDEYKASYDCVATSFFIDTAHNVLEYLEVIFAVLKPGGLWINLGPLLYHWADSAYEDDLSVEISLDDIQRVAQEMGFVLLSKKFVDAPYMGSSNRF